MNRGKKNSDPPTEDTPKGEDAPLNEVRSETRWVQNNSVTNNKKYKRSIFGSLTSPSNSRGKLMNQAKKRDPPTEDTPKATMGAKKRNKSSR